MTRSPKAWSRRPETSVDKAVSDRLRDEMTPQEVKVWMLLRDQLHPVGRKVRRQMRIGRYVVDFASLDPEVVIEIDGDDHGTDEGRRRDAIRDADLRADGFLIVRFRNNQIGRDGDAFTTALLGEIEKAAPASTLAPRTRPHRIPRRPTRSKAEP